jgi:hypothetical protein
MKHLPQRSCWKHKGGWCIIVDGPEDHLSENGTGPLSTTQWREDGDHCWQVHFSIKNPFQEGNFTRTTTTIINSDGTEDHCRARTTTIKGNGTEDHCWWHSHGTEYRVGPLLMARRIITNKTSIGSPITFHKWNLWAESEGWSSKVKDWSNPQQACLWIPGADVGSKQRYGLPFC